MIAHGASFRALNIVSMQDGHCPLSGPHDLLVSTVASYSRVFLSNLGSGTGYSRGEKTVYWKGRVMHCKCFAEQYSVTVLWGGVLNMLCVWDRLCGLVDRVPGYRTEMYCVSCEVRTEFIYVM
jgi:hypothetical protein